MGLISEWLGLGRVRASASARSRALAAARIEELDRPQGAVTFLAGGKQSKGALPLPEAGAHFEAAVYSSRGRGYARYNEDAAGVFTDARGRVYAFALDQAGGLGGRVRGAASEVAATHIFESMQALAKDGETAQAAVEGRLLSAFMAAHRALLERGQGEVTTAIAAVLIPRRAVLLNSGDSGALHFRADGGFVQRTEMHEFPPPNDACLRHALGLEPEGPAPDPYAYALEPGDWLLMGSDGLLDAGLGVGPLGAHLAEAEGAEDAVNTICEVVLRRMATLRAKPDNLSVVAVRAVPPKAPERKSKPVELGVG